jgi:hypothetical protein
VKGRLDKIPDAKYEMKVIMYLSEEAELSESAFASSVIEVAIYLEDRERHGPYRYRAM